MLVSQTVGPSRDTQAIEAGDEVAIWLPAGLLESPQRLTVEARADAPELHFPAPVQPLGIFEIRLGDMTAFAEPLIIALAYDPAKLGSSAPPEFSLVASYWDEELQDWIEMPSFVDAVRQVLLIPTFHLTKIRYDCVIADGHIYNDYFSVWYDREEMAAQQARWPDLGHIGQLSRRGL
jgi:hypothetical protein